MAGGAAFRFEDLDGMRVARCGAFDEIPGLTHLYSTRIAAGESDFDVGPAEGASPEIALRKRQLFRAAGFAGSGFALPRQVHGNVVVVAAPWTGPPPDADGVLLGPDEDGPVPAVRTADCVGILLASRDGRHAGAVHAGWRGTAAGIGARAVARLAESGSRPADLIVALGPAIGPCCYEVGDEVVAAIVSAGVPRGRFVRPGEGRRSRVDLQAANRAQLEGAGVPSHAIHEAPWCTRCANDRFFSARSEGAGTGRLLAAIGRSLGHP